MACVSSDVRGEWEFVQSLTSRNPSVDQCRGPVVAVALPPYRVFVLEHIFSSRSASDLLWAGLDEDLEPRFHFLLCAAHWLDLAALCVLRAHQCDHEDWAEEGDQIVRDVCRVVKWDTREIANMFAWQRERLT
jgi:hypothetical protein